MTETTTAEKTSPEEAVVGPDVHRGGELATTNPQGASSAVAVPSNFGDFESAVRRMLGLEDASEGELELFFHVCQKSGLDPFNKEVYMIGRNTEVAFYVPVNPNEPDGQKRKEMRWVTKYTIQTGINGFRKRAREIADQKGISYSIGEAQWCGEDGAWKEVWPESKVPTAAKFTVYRDGQPYSFVAHYSEYVQLSGNPKTPNSMWTKMPRNQLRKCAEAGANQMAFPDELGGLLLEDAAQGNIIDSDGNTVAAPARREPQRARGVAALAERVGSAEPEPAKQPIPDPAGFTTRTRKKWLDRMDELLTAADCRDQDDRRIVVSSLAGRTDTDTDTLDRVDAVTDTELRNVVEALNAATKDGTIGKVVTDIVNIWVERQAQAADAEADQGQLPIDGTEQ